MAKRSGFFNNSNKPFVYQELDNQTSVAFGIDSSDSDVIKIQASTSRNIDPFSGAQLEIDPSANGDVTITPNGTGGLVLTPSTPHSVLIGEGSSAIAYSNVGSNGAVLLGATGADPAFNTLTSLLGTIQYTTGPNSLNLEVVAALGTSSEFVAYKSSSTANATGDGTAVSLVFDSTVVNVGSDYDTGTGIYTAPSDGVYHFDVGVAISNVGALHSTYTIVFNGSVNDYKCEDINPGVVFDAGNILTGNGSITIPMSAGDTMAVTVTVSGSTKTVGIVGAALPNVSTYFHGAIINSVAAGGGGTTTFSTDSGSAAPSGGVINISGGELINTSGSGSVVSIDLDRGTNGQIPIAATGAPTVYGNITSTGGTVTISNGANTINLETSGSVPVQINTNSGAAVPAAGILTVSGTHGINTSGAGSTVTVAMNNAVTLGDLSSLGAGSSALTVTSGDITMTGNGAVGSSRILTVANSDNTSGSSNATVQVTSGGASGGDPKTIYSVNGVTNFSMGIDNSDSDKFKISASSSLGTTDIMRVSTAGEINYPLQPAFEVYLTSNVNNVTGAGASYKIGSSGTLWSEEFDQNNDFDSTANARFTAPIDGLYAFHWSVRFSGLTSSMTNGFVTLNLTDLSHVTGNYNVGAMRNQADVCSINGSCISKMLAGDTAELYIQVQFGGGDTVDLEGNLTNARTYFCGMLVA